MDISIGLNIFISVLSGILTTALLVGFGQFFNKVITPWYQDMTYKGLDISGQWFESHNYEDLILQESTISIKQTANKVTGEIILVKKSSNSQKEIEVKSFKFKGDFYNNFLNITCWNNDQKQIGTHNYLMTVRMDGREMKGVKTYYDIGMQEIRTATIYWNRKEKTV